MVEYSLINKKCVPCEGGLTPLNQIQAEEMLLQIAGWEISTDAKWLYKKFSFKNFVLALEFVNKIGAVAEQENHHPDIKLGWGYVDISLQTHAINGLHENDFILASKIDAQINT